MGPSVIDVPGTKALLEASGAARAPRARGLWGVGPRVEGPRRACASAGMHGAYCPPDFVGVSGYAPLIRPLSFEAMEISWETAAYEFGLFNISIKDLVARGKKLVYRWAPWALGGWGGAVQTSIKDLVSAARSWSAGGAAWWEEALAPGGAAAPLERSDSGAAAGSPGPWTPS
jgi:hypothetical protein